MTPKPPLNNFGNYHEIVRQMRAARRMSLTWPKCRSLGHAEWKRQARKAVFDALHYDPGPRDLRPRVIEKVETADFVGEKVVYKTVPWFDVPAYFLRPKKGKPPYPAVYLMHEWGGTPLFGKERMIQFGDEPLILVDHQRQYHSGRGLANEFTKRGYAVLVADAFHFGERAPGGFGGIPQSFNPRKLTVPEAVNLHSTMATTHYAALRYLAWSGVTWAGIFTWDDIGIDYLVSRREVDLGRIACTGLSVGAWRTNLLAAPISRSWLRRTPRWSSAEWTTRCSRTMARPRARITLPRDSSGQAARSSIAISIPGNRTSTTRTSRRRCSSGSRSI